jgi:hypothetical protein
MRKLPDAIVKNVRERNAVPYEKIARYLSDHRLHVNPHFRADWRASNTWHRAFRQLPIKSRRATWIALNRRRQVLAAAATRSSPTRIDLVTHEFGDRRLAFDSTEVNLVRYLRKTHDDPALVIDLHAAIAQPVDLIVVGHAK